MRELMDFVERFLPLNNWNFNMSAQYVCYSDKLNSVLTAQNYHGLGYPFVFYNSDKCRIKIEYSWSPRGYESSINIQYGRLGLPDDAKMLLTVTNQASYHLYWHSVYPVLYFLDELSPQESKNKKHPQLIADFEQSDKVKNIKSEPEKDILLHATIWEAYGQMLFDIFDAQNKDLWERYSTFVRQYWKTLPQV